MNHIDMIETTLRSGHAAMMQRHGIERLKAIIDREVERLNKLAETGVSNEALAAEAVRAFAAVVEARAEL